MSSGTDVTPRGGVVERWSEAQAVLSGLARTLAADEAETVVPACPLWTVHQLLAHQAGVAADVLARRMEGADPEAYVPLVPAFAPRTTDLVDPGGPA